MQLPFLRKLRYKLRRNIILRLQKRMRLFTDRAHIENKTQIYSQVKWAERRIAILDSTIEMVGTPIEYFFTFIVYSFAIIMPFYLSFRFGLNKPLITALIYLIPSLILSVLIYLTVTYGNFRHITMLTAMPMTDRISNALKWVFVSALISGISTALLPPLLMYLILTPMIAGVGSAILFLFFELTVQAILIKFVLEKFYRKHPVSAISNMFIDILTCFDELLPDNRLWKLELAQLLGDTGELMQRVLLQVFSRVDRDTFVSEISDPYIIKLIEKRVAEMAMTLRIFGKMVVFGDKKQINVVHNKITKMFTVILNNDWKNFEIEKSEELAMLIEMKPLSTKIDLIVDKIKIAIAGLSPAILLFLLQNSSYALSEKILESVLPFVVTWAFVSILNLIGSDGVVDRFLKVKSVVSSFGESVK